MTITKPALAIIAAFGCVAPAMAAGEALPRFSQIEYQVGRDPLIAQNGAIAAWHRTPPSEVAFAQAMIDAAIPDGTPTSNAVALLREAGANCGEAIGDAQVCRYHDISTRDEYVDDVRWDVRMQSSDGTVRSTTVQREWSRH